MPNKPNSERQRRMPRGTRPYDWALKQLNIAAAHKLTRGSRNIIVAVIDIGYSHHPDLDGHLWKNPDSSAKDVHGWDFADDDASLEYTGTFQPESQYYRGHHVFVAGEVAAVAPGCSVIIVRVGRPNHASWAEGIRYAVDKGARILVIPHSYLTGEKSTGRDFFHGGTDFTYPFDNPFVRQALDYAYNSNCLVFRGAADNRGRRAISAMSAVDAVFSVGSTNRHDEPADICCSTDYVEAGAPGGQRRGGTEKEQIWGCGGDNNYIPFTGGCMACGFAGGVAALLWSKYPSLSNEQVRQVLRNTSRKPKNVKQDKNGWESKLGYGILDAGKAVAVQADKLCREVRLIGSTIRSAKRGRNFYLEGEARNTGVFDAGKAVVVAYNGDPSKPSVPTASMENPARLLQVKQTGHVIFSVRGLHRAPFSLKLTERQGEKMWFETFCLDRNDRGNLHRERVRLDK